MASFKDCSTQTVFFILVFYNPFHSVTSKCLDTSPKFFLSQPEDLSVKEGSNATFTCAVSNFDPDVDRITWYVDSALYETVITPSFDERNREMTSRLTILNIGKEKHTVQCVLYVLNFQMGVQMCHSRVGTLLVQYFPEADDLQCGPKGSLVFNEGESVEVWCNVSFWNPGMSVELYLHDTTLLSNTDAANNGERTFRKTILDVRHDFHNATLTCSVTNPSLFPEQYVSCTIGTFIVFETIQQDTPSTNIFVSEGIKEEQGDIIITNEMPEVTGQEIGSVFYDQLNRTAHSQTNGTVSGFDNSSQVRRYSSSDLRDREVSTIVVKSDFSGSGRKDDRRNLADELGHNFIGIVVGAPLAAVVLIACLFAVVVIVLHSHPTQPRSNIALTDLHELQKIASMLQSTELCFSSETSTDPQKPDYAEPDYAEPQLLTNAQRPLTYKGDTLSIASYDIRNSDYSEGSRKSFTASCSGSSESFSSDMTDRSRYYEEASSCKARYSDTSTNCLYVNQTVVEMHFPTDITKKNVNIRHVRSKEMFDITDFPLPPPFPISSG